MPWNAKNSKAQKSKGKTDGPIVDQSRRFEEACEMMAKNAARFLNNNDLESSSSEDELDDSVLVQKTFSQYSDDDSQSLLKAREYILDIITSGAVICLICIQSIKRNDKIWSCYNCYGILHLHCIQKWAKDSIYHLSSVTEENKKGIASKWCCPKCRSEYALSTEQLKYLCFCGKVENPVFDTWNVPHSCGKTCEKYLKPDCSHTCHLLCHPGPCPPCPQTVLISCCCSKSAPVPRRCSHKEWSCGKICQKPLSCQLHFCEAVCHTVKAWAVC